MATNKRVFTLRLSDEVCDGSVSLLRKNTDPSQTT